MSMFDHELDASNLSCPLPILKARKALSTMESGHTLRVLTTDPGSQKDFPAFAHQTGHTLVESTEEGDKFSFVIRKN